MARITEGGRVMGCNKDWAPAEVAYLRKNYGKLPVKEIAVNLNKTRGSVYKRISKLGLNDTRSNKQWTEKEISWLEDHWGLCSLKRLARELNRTPEAVENMAVTVRKLGPSRYAQGYYTARQLAEILGVSHWSVLQWIKHKNLPAVKRATRVQKVYQIDPAKFEEWARGQDMPLLKKCLKVG